MQKLLVDSKVLICYPLNLGSADVKVDPTKETASLKSREDLHKIILDEVKSNYQSEKIMHLKSEDLGERIEQAREFIFQ